MRNYTSSMKYRFVVPVVLLVVAVIAGAVWFGSRPSAHDRVYTVAGIQALLTRNSQAWLGRTITVQGRAVTVDFAMIYTQFHLPLPHTFVLSDPRVGDPNADQLVIVYTPGQGHGQDNALQAWLRRLPLLQALIPSQPHPRFENVAFYRVRFETMPLFASTCSVARCYYASLLSTAPASQ